MIDASTRQAVGQRAENRCEYCRLPQDAAPSRTFHVEHVIACQHGGGDNVDNLALAYEQCNLQKGPNISSIDPLTTEMTRLFNPRQDNWSEHFAAEGPSLFGLTAIGRTTVRLLRFNQPDRIELRQSLIRERGTF